MIYVLAVALVVGFLMIASYLDRLCGIEENKDKRLREIEFDLENIRVDLKSRTGGANERETMARTGEVN